MRTRATRRPGDQATKLLVSGRLVSGVQSGFTLIEVVITVAIFALMAMYSHQAFGLCLKAVQRSDRAMESAFLIEKSAVDLRIRHWDRAEEDQTQVPGTAAVPGTFEEGPVKVSKSDLLLGETVFDYYVMETTGQRAGLLVERTPDT